MYKQLLGQICSPVHMHMDIPLDRCSRCYPMFVTEIAVEEPHSRFVKLTCPKCFVGWRVRVWQHRCRFKRSRGLQHSDFGSEGAEDA